MKRLHVQQVKHGNLVFRDNKFKLHHDSDYYESPAMKRGSLQWILLEF